MRLEKVENMLRLAMELQATSEGLTISDIQEKFEVSRRTAERMRNTVERILPGLEQVNEGEKQKRWRLRNHFIARSISPSIDEMVALTSASALCKRDGMKEQATALESLLVKLSACLDKKTRVKMDVDLEALVEAEGLAMRPGPRINIVHECLANLRKAILARNVVAISYRSNPDSKKTRQMLHPYGFLYGQRNYLVGFSVGMKEVRLWKLGSIENVDISDKYFDCDPVFSLHKYAENSFGVWQEEPFDVEWVFSPEAAPTAREFIFHPSQTAEELPDGRLVVRFRSGGELEMAWHLHTWGDEVRVVKPKDFWSRIKRLKKLRVLP